MCGEEGHWEEDCPQADVDMPQAKRRVTFARPPVGVGVSQAWGVETWTVSPSTDSAEARLETWTSQEVQESTNLMSVTLTMPEGHAILDCGATLDCIGEVAAARTAQAITASGETRRPAVLDKIQRFKFGGDGDPVEASFAVSLPVQVGDVKTWIEAFVVPGSTPHLISRRWLSQHRCVVNFDPDNLCLESPEFGSVPLVLHSSGHLLLSLVSSSKPVDQYAVMIDYQSSPSSVVNNFQKCDEQIIKRAGNFMSICRRSVETVPGERIASDHPVEFAVHLDDPNEEITEHWQDGLHEWYICRENQGLVTYNRSPCDVSEMRGSQSLCPCLKRRSVSVSTVLPQKPSVGAWLQRCFRGFHLFGLPSSRKVDSYGSGVVDKIAKTTRMMCWYLLMVAIMSCLDRAVHVPHGVDACLTNSSVVNSFHVGSWNSHDNLEQRVQRRVRRNRVDLVQVGGQVTAVRPRGYQIRHVPQHKLAKVSDRAMWRAKMEECWRQITLELVIQDRKPQSLLAYVADLARDQHRRGGRVFLTFPWKWNVLTTWPIQSVISGGSLFACS